MPADGAVDGPVRGAEVPADHGQVDLLDRARTELPRERLERRRRARHQQHARGVAVEAVHDAGPIGAADPGQRPEPMGERVHHRAAPRAGRGVHDHAGRLVDGEQVCVLVEDGKGERLWLRRQRLGLGQLDLQPRAGAEQVGALARHPVDAHAPRVDQPLRLRPRPHLRHPRQEAIEAHARPAGGYDQLDAPRDARRRGARRGAGGGAAATFEGAARVAGPSRSAQRRPSGSAGAPAGPSPRTGHDPPPSTRRARSTSRAIAARSASGPLNASSPRRRSISLTTSQRR